MIFWSDEPDESVTLVQVPRTLSNWSVFRKENGNSENNEMNAYQRLGLCLP